MEREFCLMQLNIYLKDNEMTIFELFDQAEKMMKERSSEASKIFEEVLLTYAGNDLEEIEAEKLQIYALSNYYLFLLSMHKDIARAEMAIKLFEYLISHDKNNFDILEPYICVLELTYQFEKSYSFLLSLLNVEATKLIALKFLSSYIYYAEGLQSYQTLCEYKKQFYDLTSDPVEKSRLYDELKEFES